MLSRLFKTVNIKLLKSKDLVPNNCHAIKRCSHSLRDLNQYNTLDVMILPALQDNYMYLLIDKSTKLAAAVDPVEPNSIMHALQSNGMHLACVLTTHHHWDHAGGNAYLRSIMPDLTVVGSESRIEGITDIIKPNQQFTLGNMLITCLFTPCHTAGDVSYFVQSKEEEKDRLVFAGDTLFVGGCGRFFEGTPSQMHQALSLLGQLPDDTKVYCGHEYTVPNLLFASHVEPTNVNIKKKLEWAKKRRHEFWPTVPSTIGDEKTYNPFMRLNEKTIQQQIGVMGDPALTMKTLRDKCDNFVISA